MTSSGRSNKPAKLSPGLASRLEQLRPDQKIQVIVMLRSPAAAKSGAGRQGSADREAAIQAVKESARLALGDVDDILERLGGRRLADGPDVFGAVPVKATPAAIQALARCRKVKAILEDQAIHGAF